MSDNNMPNILDGFIAVNNPLPTNFNPEIMQTLQPDMSHLNKQVEENLKHIIPFEERVKPITDRQDKTIKTLEEQIDVYKIENQSLRLQLEKVNTHLREETAKREEETAKRELAESKLTLKDWKTFLWGGVIGALGTKFIEWLFNIVPKIIELISQK